MTSSAQLIVRMRGMLVGSLALLAAQLAGSSPAQASCIGPELQLLWSYPEAGAEQVPTNVVIWAITSVWGAKPSATIDGAPVELQGTPTFSGVYLQPQKLAPNSDHTLVLDYARSPNAVMPATQTRFEIKFKTGDGPAEGTVAAPAVTGNSRVLTGLSYHSCTDVIAAQDCFDTGQNALLSLEVEVEDDETLGWLLKTSYQGSSAVWPARCGLPSVYIHHQESLCHQVQRIGAGGRLSEAVEYCSEPTPPLRAPTPAAGVAGGAQKPSTAPVPAVAAPHPGADAGPGDRSAAAASVGGARAHGEPPASAAGCATVSGARTAARAFWAIVAIALLLAHHQRQHRRRPRGCLPSRRFRL
jgi:hypothetical protein